MVRIHPPLSTAARGARSLEEAAAYVEEHGIVLVLPSVDLVLRSLWEGVAGPRPLDWAVRDEEGAFVSFTPEMDRVWRWKDELPERRLACAGRHFGRSAVLVAPALLGAAYALTGRAGRPDDFRGVELAPLEREVAEAVLEHGPCTTPEVRLLLGTADKRPVDRAVAALQRRLVLTNAGVSRREQGWPAILLDVLARRWHDRVGRLVPPEEARRRLARTVLAATDEVSAADVAAALGWRVRQAAAVLEALVEEGAATVRVDAGLALWSRGGGAEAPASGA